MDSLKQQISEMFREDYYLRNRVSSKHFYQFKDRVIGLIADYEKTQRFCDNNPEFACPVNDEGRNRTCRKDGYCAITSEEGC